MEEFDLGNLNADDINAAIEGLQVDVQPEIEVPTDTSPPQPEQVQQPSTEGQTEQTDEGFKIPSQRSTYGDQSVGGVLKGTALGMAETAAPLVGISDTVIDTINFLSAGDKYDIPKIPEYESNTTQALRNISGLIIPSLGLRAKLL